MKILLPVDGSDLSLEAVRYALRMAQDGLQINVVLANVQEPANLYEVLVAHDELDLPVGTVRLKQGDAIYKQVEAWLGAQVKDGAAPDPGAEPWVRLMRGAPGVIELATTADPVAGHDPPAAQAEMQLGGALGAGSLEFGVVRLGVIAGLLALSDHHRPGRAEELQG